MVKSSIFILNYKIQCGDIHTYCICIRSNKRNCSVLLEGDNIEFNRNAVLEDYFYGDL